MRWALLMCIIVGTALGLLLPTAETAAPIASAAAPAQEVTMKRSYNGHFYVDAEVGEDLVHFMVDTGASDVALTMRDADRLGIPYSESQFTVIGTGASGPVMGQPIVIDSVSVGGKKATQIEGSIVQGLDISLLGQAYLGRIGSIEIVNDHMVLR